MERDLLELPDDVAVALNSATATGPEAPLASDDDALLQAYVGRGESQAFRQLVERYTPIVYAAARRQLRDAHLCEDVTQAVFILLARRARSISGDRVAGWLINTARLAAKAAARAEARRTRREHFAMTTASRSTPTMPQSDPTFEEAADAALCRLGDADRTAITLRYLRGMSQREVAQAMHVSENAAAQRLSRALAKLRKILSGGGGSALAIVSPAAIGEQLQLLTRDAAHPPAGLAEVAADAGLRGMGLALPVGSIARAVVSSMRWQIGIRAGFVVAALFLVVSVTLFASQRNDRNEPSISNSQAALGPIRVGIYISATTALPRPPENNAWFQQFRVVDELRGVPGMTLIPIIEPGHDQHPQQKRLLRYYFADTPGIYATDTVALAKLDVIVASAAHEVPIEALASVEAAVQGGTGLYIRGCFGGCSPGMTQSTAVRLRGFSSGISAQNPSAQDCLVVGDHPILGTLSRKAGESLAITPAGAWGSLRPGGSSLLRLRSNDALLAVDGKRLPNYDTLGSDMLYVSELGKGRIVGFNFAGVTPEPLQRATGNRFVAGVVQWAAHRPVK